VTDAPWPGDACSLVDAFRAGERSPAEELHATLAAIESSSLNAFSFLDPERARAEAAAADVSKPFGGVPTAIKELDPVQGWPLTEASLVFRDRVAPYSSHLFERLHERGGIVPVGQTTASEFGGLNVSTSRLHGVTHNPWRHGRTAGGSSGGSAAAVAGGLVSLATGGDGGGSIRIPAGYTGLLGFKGTFGRIPRGPHAYMRPNTVVLGNLSRSVRDAARFYDVCAGAHSWDPSSLPSHGRWEAGLGSHELRGRRVAIVPDLSDTPLDPGVEDHLRREAKALIAATGMVEVDLDLRLPNLAAQWALGNLATLLADLGDVWPRCSSLLTDELAIGLHLAEALYNLRTAAVAEELRIEANEAMGRAFDEVDFVIAATNPGPAFPAEASTSNELGPGLSRVFAGGASRYAVRGVLGTVRALAALAPKLPSRALALAEQHVQSLVTMGGLTIISNVCGNPAASIPAGTIDGLPVGMQVLGRHHEDELLFDVALAVERERAWPLVAPAA
jgi:aspartyl-tRNA(Asn)/glutamyl-tRNA(Gln) amidotransferase subunit A